MALLETIVRDRCGVHAARLLRIIMQVCARWRLMLALFFFAIVVLLRIHSRSDPNRNFQKMKMETRSVWDYGLVSPKTIGRPALCVPLS
jgi:hypothetical protein